MGISPSVSGDETLDRADLQHDDARLGAALESRRLIAEVGLERTQTERWKKSLLQPGAGWRYPNLAAVVTVGVGVFAYHEGDFWDAFPEIDQPRRQRWGERFEEFLRQHPTLEKFEFLKTERAHRFVAPILGHGGVPCSCLEELFSILTSRCGPEYTGSEAIEELVGWKQLKNAASRPVHRFVRFGGEVAEDLVGRLLSVWDARDRGAPGSGVGLPAHIAVAFDEWFSRIQPARAPQARRFPRPSMVLDPALMKITIHLPRCSDQLGRGAKWKALDGLHPADRDSWLPILSPQACWEVKVGAREFRFSGCSEQSAAMLFAPDSGLLVRDPEKRRLPSQVWALYQTDEETEPAPVLEEQFLPWAGYEFGVFDLSGGEQLRIGPQIYEVQRPFFEVDDDGSLVPLARSAPRALPVRSRPPTIRWEGKAILHQWLDGQDKGGIDLSCPELPLLLQEAGEYDLRLTGPVGQNLRFSYALVPGLAVEVDPKVRRPDTPLLRWKASAGDAEIQHDGLAGTAFESTGDTIRLEVMFPVGAGSVSLECSAPSIAWCLALDPEVSGAHWTTKPQMVSVSDLVQSSWPALLVRLPGAGVDADVVLAAASTHTITARPSGGGQEDLWRADLRHARDESLKSGAPSRYELTVRSAGLTYRGPILEVRPQWDIDGLRANWRRWESTHVVTISWEERGPAVLGRWIEMLPVWRPWDSCTLRRELRPDEARELRLHFSETELRPGRYAVRAIHAPWGLAHLPAGSKEEECFVDVYPEVWPQVFSFGQGPPTMRGYFEALLAHWHNPERVRRPPAPPDDLTPADILWFLDHFKGCNDIERIKIPHDGSGALTVFLVNSEATVAALTGLEELPPEWERILPSADVLSLVPTSADKEFLVSLVLNELAGFVVQDHRRRALSPPLQAWHRSLLARNATERDRPRPDDVIFLCERFGIIEDRCADTREAYMNLKATYMGREAT